MKNIKISRCIFGVSVLILVALVVILAIGYNMNNINSQNEQDNVSQENQVLDFYYQNKDTLNDVKNALYDSNYSVREIRDDGYIQLSDGTEKWLPEISSDIKQILNDGKACNITSIHLSKFNDNTAFWLEALSDENNEAIYLVYSDSYSEPEHLVDNYMYSDIENDWYLFVGEK